MSGKMPFDRFEEKPLPRGKHWREAFDSRYLRVYWLAGKPRIVTIKAVEMLKSSNKRESKQQLLITLDEAEKKWAINVTNAGTIEMLTGKSDPNEWVGVRIELYVTKTRDPSGQIVDCIRVREELPAADRKTEKPKHRQEVSQYLHEMKEAADLQACIPVADRIAEDNDLSAEETQLLLDALKKRRGQLGAAAPGAV